MPGLYWQMKRLVKHSALYGLGGLTSRVLAVLFLPLYTRYLTPGDYGALEIVVAGTAVLGTIFHAGVSSAFFRFYFDSDDQSARLRVVQTSFWFTLTSSTVALLLGVTFAPQIAEGLLTSDRTTLVRVAVVSMWAQMNYSQLTALFRVEERSLAFVSASVANVLLSAVATVGAVVVLDWGATGVVAGSAAGTLLVYGALLAYRRDQLGLRFSRELLREMNRFGVPLVPSSLALLVVNVSDRFFINSLAGTAQVGIYSTGVRVSSAAMLLLVAFRTGWPAFAYSIKDDREARRTYAFVLTYLLFAACWLAVALALLSPWLVRLLTTPEFYSSSRVVAPLAFAAVAYAGYTAVSIGVGRARRTQFNWVVTGAAALVNVTLNLILIPAFGIMGAAVATLAAYTTMFAGITWRAQRVYPVAYQWRRVTIAVGAAVGLTVAGKLADFPLPGTLALVAAYPLLLLVCRFYLPAELDRLRPRSVRT